MVMSTKIKITKQLLESINNDNRLLISFENNFPTIDNYIFLFHETNIQNLKNILKHGISLEKALNYNGNCIWASDKLNDSNNWMYGNVAIKFWTSKDKVNKANNTEYRVYDNIAPMQIVAIYTMTPRTEIGKEHLLNELGLNEDLNEELTSKLKELGFKFTNNIPNGASYLLKDGTFLSMEDNRDILKPINKKATHPDLDYYLLDKELINIGDNANRALISNDNAIRLNDGTNFRNEGAMITLPTTSLTPIQYKKLEDWLYNLMYFSKEVEIDTIDNSYYNKYNFIVNPYSNEGYTPEEIIKDIKSKYSLNEFMRGKTNVSDKRILQYVNECIEDMKHINYGVADQDMLTFDDINIEEGNTVHTFGALGLPQNGEGNFRLVLNKYMFDEPEEAIKNTIYHELCHYVVDKIAIDKDIIFSKNGKWYARRGLPYAKNYLGHGSMWKHVANIVGKAVGHDITRTNSYDLHTGVGAHAEEKYNYIIKCKHCGYEFKFVRKSGFVKDVLDGDGHTKNYWCQCEDGTKSHDFEIIKGR